MSLEVLKKLAEKLGITSASVVKKAEEHYRRCSAKSTLGLSNFSDTAKSCALLHIACEELSAPLDKVCYAGAPSQMNELCQHYREYFHLSGQALATRLSCLTKPAYLKLLHTLKSLLDVGATPTVSSLCSSLGISELTQPAKDLLNKYEKSAPERSFDASQPMYACAAVMATCKRQRVNVDKTYLKENCRVKWAEVKKIAGEMIEMTKKTLENRKRRNVAPDPSAIAAEIEKKSAKLDDHTNGKHKDALNETEEDEYEAWKRKILEQAS